MRHSTKMKELKNTQVTQGQEEFESTKIQELTTDNENLIKVIDQLKLALINQTNKHKHQ